MPKLEILDYIPTLDLRKQHAAIADEIEEALKAVFATTSFVLGPAVKDLERRIADYVGCEYGVGVASGTDALRLALAAGNIGPGDEVITTAFSFIATANTITRAGATPVFVDIDPVTFNLDHARLEEGVTSRTKAIIPVHLYGQPCQMEEIVRFCRGHEIFMIEDCAQAIGATWDAHPVGSFGHLGCFSFYPTKNLGADGDAGMIVSRDEGLAKKVDILRRHGSPRGYVAEVLGFNSRLDSLQAAILGVKLNYLDRWNERRRLLARRYSELLAGIDDVSTPLEVSPARHVFHQYTIRAKERDRLKDFLHQRGVGSMIYYPVGIHRQPMYAELGYLEGSLPETERASQEVLSLPIFPELTESQQDRIAQTIRSFYAGS